MTDKELCIELRKLNKELEKNNPEVFKIYNIQKKNCNNKYFKIMEKIIEKYKKENMDFHFTNTDIDYCYLESRSIYISLEQYEQPSEETIFNLLHEIGHIKTNTNKMKRCEQEYAATDWAIKESSKYNIILTKELKTMYQNYIYKWRNTAIKKHAKSVPSKNDMRLIWE